MSIFERVIILLAICAYVSLADGVVQSITIVEHPMSVTPGNGSCTVVASTYSTFSNDTTVSYSLRVTIVQAGEEPRFVSKFTIAGIAPDLCAHRNFSVTLLEDIHYNLTATAYSVGTIQVQGTVGIVYTNSSVIITGQ